MASSSAGAIGVGSAISLITVQNSGSDGCKGGVAVRCRFGLSGFAAMTSAGVAGAVPALAGGPQPHLRDALLTHRASPPTARARGHGPARHGRAWDRACRS